jgi:hypothetical protein
METLTKEQQAVPAVDSLPGVQSRIPLRIATSDIASAGMGIVAEKRVRASEEIFRVTHPLMNVTYGKTYFHLQMLFFKFPLISSLSF